MVDSRSAGLIGGIAGGINFRSGDISGTAAKTADDRASQGTEYFMQNPEEKSQTSSFIDRSMELCASLNSLALLNLPLISKNNRRKSIILDDEDLAEKIRPAKVEAIGERSDEQNDE